MSRVEKPELSLKQKIQKAERELSRLQNKAEVLVDILDGARGQICLLKHEIQSMQDSE